MKVAIVGAGALGAVYGVRLARRSHASVSFVVRRARTTPEPLLIERVRRGERERIDAPAYLTRVPDDADLIVLTVGTEDLAALVPTLDACTAPIVVLTPMLPPDYEALVRSLGSRVFAAMPNVIAYRRDDGVVRYWLPPAPTRIDEPRKGGAAHAVTLESLATELRSAGLRTRFDLAVHETNPATTACFIAIPMVLGLAGTTDALSKDERLLDLATRACREGAVLGSRLGSPEPWASAAAALASPWSIRAAFGALGRLSPEASFYAEHHFGTKLMAQHARMASQLVMLARARRLPSAALSELERALSDAPPTRA